MKRITRAALAATAAIALAIIPAMSASAAATQTATITQAWGYQYQTLLNPAKTIQAVIDYENGDVYLVDVTTNSVTQVTDSGATFDDPYRGAFTPDGATLYVGNYGDNTISIIDVATATVTGTFSVQSDEVTAIGVSPDGSLLITTDDYGSAFLFDLSNAGAMIGIGAPVSSEINGVYFQSATQALLVGDDGALFTMNLTDGTVSLAFGDATASSYGVCASPDLSTIYMPDYDNGDVLYVIDAATGDVTDIDLTSLVTSDGFGLCDVSPDGTILVTDWYNPVVLVVDGATKTAKSAINISGLTGDVSDPLYANGVTDGINAISDCKFIVNGYYGNGAIVDQCPSLPNTGVDTVAMTAATAGGLALVALGALAVVLVRRRATR